MAHQTQIKFDNTIAYKFAPDFNGSEFDAMTQRLMNGRSVIAEMAQGKLDVLMCIDFHNKDLHMRLGTGNFYLLRHEVDAFMCGMAKALKFDAVTTRTKIAGLKWVLQRLGYKCVERDATGDLFAKVV